LAILSLCTLIVSLLFLLFPLVFGARILEPDDYEISECDYLFY